MIAEIIPAAYDATGTRVFHPEMRRRSMHPTFPMGRYLREPLSVKIENISDIRTFLAGCKGVTDREEFGKDDYWQPPEQFEQTRHGDCEDFALWTWRAFLALGYDARFVGGTEGRYNTGHAWVQFARDGKHFLVEPQLARIQWPLPRLNTLSYHPKFSAAWNGTKVKWYAHQDRDWKPRVSELLPIVPEWLIWWGLAWARFALRLPARLYNKGEIGSP